MRLTPYQCASIKRETEALFGERAEVRVFGSRLNDTSKGGDIDLIVSTQQPVARPALSAAKLATKLSRVFDGRKVDVLIHSPTLKELPIHRFALDSGERL
ncbi:nucleotidyltransferase domain-containing protein [Marinimicrobium sp. ARAG 43.8]|uniref:nucleotidyltransferase domain-containing protein n=1 Tax=Marinimicrobium sp. ARAG 43.8 TaxID=3418719 RepID=UPI003CECFA83